MSSPRLLGFTRTLGLLAQWPFSRGSFIRRMPLPPFSRWTRTRDLPCVAAKELPPDMVGTAGRGRKVREVLGTPPEKFIASVREALGRKAGPPERPYARLAGGTDLRGRAGTEATLERLSANRRANVDELARVAELRGWIVHRAAGVEDAVGYVIRSGPEARGPRRVVRSVEEVFNDVPLDDALSSLGATVQVMARDERKRRTVQPRRRRPGRYRG